MNSICLILFQVPDGCSAMDIAQQLIHGRPGSKFRVSVYKILFLFFFFLDFYFFFYQRIGKQ